MFFRRKNKTDNKKQQLYEAAPGTNIRFDPGLIKQLEAEHKALLELYGEIKSDFDARDYKTVGDKLKTLRRALQEHLLAENVKLYIYLSYSFKGDPSRFELIRGFRKEMDGIAKTAMGFLKKYSDIGVDASLAPGFKKDFATIGEVLGARIQKEESTLYPLYSAQS